MVLMVLNALSKGDRRRNRTLRASGKEPDTLPLSHAVCKEEAALSRLPDFLRHPKRGGIFFHRVCTLFFFFFLLFLGIPRNG